MQPKVKHPEPYDPLNYDNLAENVVQTLMKQQCEDLPPREPFEGVGVYAIYYAGRWAPYSRVTGTSVPIYVGSALPAGKRKGDGKAASGGRALFNRLTQHARSIEQAENLKLSDFKCRFLVVVPVWIGLAEQCLIKHFRPLWNTVIDGFGNHDPGAGRDKMKRPRRDILHPGRPWGKKLRAAEGVEDILKTLTR